MPPVEGTGVFPLRVAASGRHLVDQGGTPFFVHGDTAWSLTHNLTYDEAVRYLEDRKRRGVTALIIYAPDAYGPDGVASFPPDRQGQQPFIARDITQPNEAYWQHVDRVLAKTEEMGFLVFYWPFYLGCCNDGYLGLFQQNGVARAREYGRFVGRRYGVRRNLIWVHGGDLNPDTGKDLVAAVKGGIEEVGPDRLHGTHWAPETDPWGPYGDAFTDLHLTYTYRPVAALAAEHYAHQPTKPVILLESHYEGDWAGKSAEDVRRYPYQALLSGATGHFFGNRPLWFLGHGWEAALNSPGSRYMEHAGRLFRSRPWSLLVPTEPGQFVTAGVGDPRTDGGVQSARAGDGGFAMAFVPDSRTIDVDLRQLSGSTVRAWWFDVVTGAATAVGDFPAAETRRFAAPGGEGFVLVLDDASRGFTTPGRSSLP